MIPSITNRYFRDRWACQNRKTVLVNSTLAGEFAVSLMAGKTEENFYVISLDSIKRVIAVDLVGVGDEDEVLVNTKEIVQIALKRKAHSVLLAHNHPNGCVHPSESDMVRSKGIATVFDGMGILLIDHIIVSGNNFLSMSERGFLDDRNDIDFENILEG